MASSKAASAAADYVLRLGSDCVNACRPLPGQDAVLRLEDVGVLASGTERQAGAWTTDVALCAMVSVWEALDVAMRAGIGGSRSS